MTSRRRFRSLIRLRVVNLLGLCCLLASCNAPAGEIPRSGPVSSSPEALADPLPSWNEGEAKKALIGFVGRTTTQGGADFVAPAERIAVFDNDGTLWAEQPMYFQLAFALDRIRVLAAKHPEWKTTQPFKGVLEGDVNAVVESGPGGLMQVIAASHAGNTTEEFESIVSEWMASARHPVTKRPYNEMIYQ